MHILGSVLALSALSFCVGQENNSQLVETAPSIKTYRVTTSPVIDGKLTDDCWLEAEAATDFWLSNGLSRIESSASVQLAYDDENLFVGFRCPLPNPQSVTAVKNLKPDQRLDRNTAQVFLDPLLNHRRDVGLAENPDALFYTHPGPKIFRFAVNPVNGRFSDLLGIPGEEPTDLVKRLKGANNLQEAMIEVVEALHWNLKSDPDRSGGYDPMGTLD